MKIPNTIIKPGVSSSVYVSGIKYPSLFNASYKTDISNVSFYKALKKSGGEPCKIKRNIVVLEAWVINRVRYLNMGIV